VSDVFRHRSRSGKLYCRTRSDVGSERVKLGVLSLRQITSCQETSSSICQLWLYSNVYRVYQYTFFLADCSLKWIKFLPISCLDCKFCFPCVHSFCLTAIIWKCEFFRSIQAYMSLRKLSVCVYSFVPRTFVITKTLQVSVLLQKLTNVWGQLNELRFMQFLFSPGHWNCMKTACPFYGGFSRSCHFFGSSSSCRFKIAKLSTSLTPVIVFITGVPCALRGSV
jgi:hypothetical protein